MLKRNPMKLYYLAGFTVDARSRSDAVRKFVRLGFAERIARVLVREVKHAGHIGRLFLEV